MSLKKFELFNLPASLFYLKLQKFFSFSNTYYLIQSIHFISIEKCINEFHSMHEESLIDRLKDASQKRMAFHELVTIYQEKLYWHIRKIVIDHDDTDDILQNVFVKVWNNIDSFREESSLYTWLFRIATNESLTFLSKQKRRNKFFVTQQDDFLTGKLEADLYFEGDEIQRKLMEEVLKLPEKQRLVFNMKYFDGMKFTEIAEILQLTTGALKASYHIAVKKIEENLKKHN